MDNDRLNERDDLDVLRRERMRRMAEARLRGDEPVGSMSAERDAEILDEGPTGLAAFYSARHA